MRLPEAISGMIARRRITYILSATLLGAPVGHANAGEGSTRSESRSNDSSDGSKGSNDSSRTSGDSSKRSGESSQGSGQRSEDSSERSPSESIRWTTRESSESKGGTAVSGALLIMVVGGSVVGGILSSRGSSKRQEQQEARALARFLQRHHALIARDVVLGEGPLLAAWGNSLGLTAAERERLGLALDGSTEQTELLQALNGNIDETRARRFAASFARLSGRTLGRARFAAVVHAASR